MTIDTLRVWLRRHWPNVAIVAGTMLLVLGLSGFQGGISRTGTLARYSRGAAFPSFARLEMVAGAALIAAGVLYRRENGR